MLDTKALAEATALIVREHVAAAVGPLLDRITALEAREAAVPEKGDRGEPGLAGADGKDADPALIASQVERAVAKAIAVLPAPEKGERGEQGEKGAPGADGKDGERGADGKDGVGLAGMMIDRSGEAVATLTDGTLIKLGPVVGRDGNDGAAGEPGKDGRDGPAPADFTMEVLEDGRTLRIGICREGDDTEYAFQLAFPVPIDRGDHEAGKSYTEGDVVTAGGSLWIARSDTAETPGEGADWRLAVAKGPDGSDAYAGEARGLHDANERYRKMDVVSFNGSEWRAKQDDPGEIPGPGWMLSACKGKRGDRGERGPDGKDGVTPVALYRRGDTLVATLSDGGELTADLGDLVTTPSD